MEATPTFLGIPVELRKLIYRHLLISRNPIAIKPFIIGPEWQPSATGRYKHIPNDAEGTPLTSMAVSRQIRQGAAWTYYGENRFNLTIINMNGSLYTPFITVMRKHLVQKTPKLLFSSAEDDKVELTITRGARVSAENRKLELSEWTNLQAWLKSYHDSDLRTYGPGDAGQMTVGNRKCFLAVFNMVRELWWLPWEDILAVLKRLPEVDMVPSPPPTPRPYRGKRTRKVIGVK